MSNDQERRVYHLSDDHAFDWADVEDLVPDEPKVPKALRPFYPTGETVEYVDDLSIHAHGGEPPRFSGLDQCVEATPQEMAEWLAAWADARQAQQAFRDRLKKAKEAYEAAAQEALAELTEATKPWVPVEATLKQRSAELAAKLHSHRLAAEEYMRKRETQKQEHLDTVHGPRALVLYKPERLGSPRQADHIARVHLTTCKRRPKKGVSGVLSSGRDNDEGLRANDAWARLSDPNKWIDSVYGDVSKNMRVKFCSFCKPWRVFMEHLDEVPFPAPRYVRGAYFLGDLQLTELPEAWTADLTKEN